MSEESGIIFNNNLTSDNWIKKVNENEEERYMLEQNVKQNFDKNTKSQTMKMC